MATVKCTYSMVTVANYIYYSISIPSLWPDLVAWVLIWNTNKT